MVNPLPPALSQAAVQELSSVGFPTLGHYLEEGFVDPAIRCLVPAGQAIVGAAVTVRTTATDSTALHHAAGMVLPGQVLVIDTGGDRIHAPLGEVVATQLKVRGAAGVIVDGVVTDIDQLHRIGVPVYARGTSLLTTKLIGAGGGGVCVPIVCGGVSVNPGHLVLADSNGVLIVSQEKLDSVWQAAVQDDEEEPELIRLIESGELLGELTGASALVEQLRDTA